MYYTRRGPCALACHPSDAADHLGTVEAFGGLVGVRGTSAGRTGRCTLRQLRWAVTELYSVTEYLCGNATESMRDNFSMG